MIMLTMRLVALLEVADSHAIIAAMIEETMVSGLQSHGMLVNEPDTAAAAVRP